MKSLNDLISIIKDNSRSDIDRDEAYRQAYLIENGEPFIE